jgi:hypothetical protein
MSAENFAYWGASLVPPIGTFALNVAVRWPHALKSSGADWLLVLIGFDATAVLTAKDLSKYVQHPEIQGAFSAFMMASLFFTLILWYVLASRIETYLSAPMSSSAWMRARRYLAYLAVWSLITIVSSAHVYVFLYKPS